MSDRPTVAGMPRSPTHSLSRAGAACHLYAHANGEEYLLLDLPGDGTFSLAWTAATAHAHLLSTGWEPGAPDVDPRLGAIVAERLAAPRQSPSEILAELGFPTKVPRC